MDPTAPSYVERRADRELLEALLGREYVFLLDSRQKGKSSLIARAMLELKAQGVRTIKLDLQRIGSNLSADQWYAGLLNEVGLELGCSGPIFEVWSQLQHIGPLARFVNALGTAIEAISDPVVIFVDEIDFVRALPFSADEFFAAIRDCYNRRSQSEVYQRLTFCLSGVATASQLIQNPEITPFNIGRRVALADFRATDLKPYEEALTQEGLNGPALLGRIYFWVSGHPYLTQFLCAECVTRRARSTEEIDQIVQGSFLHPERRRSDPHLADVERRLLEPYAPELSVLEACARVLELYRQVLKGRRVGANLDDPSVSSLVLAGIAKNEEGRLEMRNRVYTQVFNERWRRSNLPDAERRRQRGAALRAAVKTAAVSTAILIAMGALALKNQQLANTAEEERDRALYESYASSMISATQFWEDHFLDGIAQIVKSQQRSPYRGWEWEYWNHIAGASVLKGDDGSHLDFRWSIDGKSVFCRGSKGITQLDAVTGEQLMHIPAPASELCITFELPGGRLADISWNQTLTVYDLKTKTKLYTDNIPELYWRPNAILHPSRRYVVGSHLGDPLWIYDFESRKLTITNLSLDRPSFSADGSQIVGQVNHDQEPVRRSSIVRVEFPSLRRLSTLDLEVRVNSTLVTGSVLIVTCSGGAVRMYRLSDGHLLSVIETQSLNGWRMDLSPDKTLLSVGTLNRFSKIYDISQQSLHHVATVAGCVDAFWSPSGKLVLANYFQPRVVALQDAYRPPIQLRGGVDSAWIAETSGVVAEAIDNEVIHWDIKSQSQKHVLKVKGTFNSQVRSSLKRVVDSTGETWLDAVSLETRFSTPPKLQPGDECAELGKSSVFLLRKARALYLCRDESEPKLIAEGVQKIYASPTGQHVITVQSMGQLRIWNREVDRWHDVDGFAPFTLHDVRFLPDEKTILGAFDNGRVWLIDLQSGRKLRMYGDHAGNAASVAISPDGTRVVSGGSDRALRVWDFHTGRLLSVLKGHQDEVCQIEFCQNGKTIVSRDNSGQVRVWRTTSDGL